LRVSRAAYLLGYAGLLPQVAAVMLMAGGRVLGGEANLLTPAGLILAFTYGCIILSFLGGMWWSIAMRREADQGYLLGIAVLPSLLTLVIVGWAALSVFEDSRGVGPLIGLGVAITATLLVDHHLVRTGEVPVGWMRLRAPLSLGLGGLTILAGVLAA
jgi:hypothetical protein